MPKIGLAEINPEDIIKNRDKIELKEKDTKLIIKSLTQKLNDKKLDLPNIEEQAVLVILQQAIKKNIAYYLFIDVLKKLNVEFGFLYDDEPCCGGPLHTYGLLDDFQEHVKKVYSFLKERGVKRIITINPICGGIFKKFYPDVLETFDIEVKHFSEFIIENNLLSTLEQKLQINAKVTFHDPCRMGRLGGHLYEPPREILNKLSGVELVEMKNIKDNSNCCGVSSFKNCNSNTKQLRANRINEALETGAEYLITTCPKCMTHFSCYVNEVDNEGNEKPESEKIKIQGQYLNSNPTETYFTDSAYVYAFLGDCEALNKANCVENALFKKELPLEVFLG